MEIKRKATTNILMYLLLALIVYFMSNFVVFSEFPSEHFNELQYWLVFAGIVIVAIPFFYLDWKYNNYKPNRFFAVMSLVLFIIGMVVLIKVPHVKSYYLTKDDGTVVPISIVYNTKDRIFDILSLAVCLFTTYLMVTVVPKHFKFKRHTYFILFCAIAIVMSMVIYSYVVEWQKYANFFQLIFAGEEINDDLMPQSFFDNKNSYALILFIAMYIMLIFHNNHPKWYYLALSFTIYIHIIFTISKTAIVFGFLLFIGYLLGRFCLTYKKHKKRNLITMSIFLMLFLISFIGVFVLVGIKPTVVENIINASYSAMNNRFRNWRNDSELLNQTNWFIGTGFNYFNEVLLSFNNQSALFDKVPYSHNAFLAILGQGGILMLIGYALYLSYFIYVLVKLAKNKNYENKNIVMMSSVFLIAIMLYGMLESVSPIFLMGLDKICIAFLLFTPALSRYYQMKRPLEDVLIIKNSDQFKSQTTSIFKSHFNISRVLYFIITPVVSMFVGFWASIFIPYPWNDGRIYNFEQLIPYAIGGGVLIIAFLILPYIIQVIYNKAKKLDKTYYHFGRYLLNEALPYYMTFICMALTVFVIVITSNQFIPNDFLNGIGSKYDYFLEIMPNVILISAVCLLLYLTIFMLSKFLREKSGCINQIDFVLNKLLLKICARFILKEDHPYIIPNMVSCGDYKKPKVLLIAPPDFYYGDLYKQLNIDSDFYINIYNNSFTSNRRITNLANLTPWLYENFTWDYLNKILIENIMMNYDFIVVKNKKLITKKMITQISIIQNVSKLIIVEN